MEKKNKLIFIVLITFTIIVLGVLIYSIINTNLKNSDALKFKNEFMEYNDKTIEDLDEAYLFLNISEDNNVKYLNKKNVIKSLSSLDGIYLFGSPDNQYTREIVNSLFEKCKSKNIRIYYLNSNKIDEELESKIVSYIDYEEVERINVPFLIGIRDKEIYNIMNGTSEKTLKEDINGFIDKYTENNLVCSIDKC
jgi:hypothetical protein